MEPRHERRYLERQPALIRGGKALLFERLCAAPESIPDVGDVQALARSVLRELRNLLNTRLPIAAGWGDERWSDESGQTVVNYGLPDFSLLNAASPADRTRLASLLQTKIAAFEPRLRQVRVEFVQDPANKSRLIGSVKGILQTAYVNEPVSFDLSNGQSGLEIQRAEHASGR